MATPPCLRCFTTLLRVQGEQHILAAAAAASSSKQQQQQQAAASSQQAASLFCHKLGIPVAQNDRTANADHHKQVLCYFEPSSLFYGPFSLQKMAIFSLFCSRFQDNHPESSGRSPVCRPSVSNAAMTSTTQLGPSISPAKPPPLYLMLRSVVFRLCAVLGRSGTGGGGPRAELRLRGSVAEAGIWEWPSSAISVRVWGCRTS